jgi:1-acyl-sn-glycerol-3-phosphate acyltransferase
VHRSSLRSAVHAVRSITAIMVFFVYLVVLGLVQRVIVFPLCWILPGRRTQMLGEWIRWQAYMTRAIVQGIAGVRIAIEGVDIRESAIVIMNHQSVLDIPIALSRVKGPAALIPVRTRYRRGIPGISPFLRAARYPFITQRRSTIRQDIEAVAEGARRATAGEVSIIVFPEGLRTMTGARGPFMPRGLMVALASRRPVYCIVGDGMWKVRTLKESLTSLAGTSVTVRISGPFAPPEQEADMPAFIASLRERMERSLQELRAEKKVAAPEMARAAD